MDQISQTPEKAKLFKALFVVFVLLAVFLGAETLNAIKEYSHIGTVPTSTNAISVSGTGEVFAVPDIATFSFSVVTPITVQLECENQGGTFKNDY